MKLEPVIGLEIHVQLKTQSKMFCSCSNRGEHEAPNTTICSVCLGHPGTLPVVNQQAVEFGLRAGLALGGTPSGHSKFDRKNYFYPDLPKGYQISQFDLPVITGGALDVEVTEGGQTKQVRVRITRLHLEEDAAKLHHSTDGSASLVDFNRAGTPLAEIVTEPDLRTPAEAKAFLQELRLMMRYLGVSDADMEKGHLRCDANVSLREVPEDPENEQWAERLNPKTEVKNLNSFRAVERAVDYEIKRQTKLWLDGKPVSTSSTRGWDDARGITVEQRSKEGANDYRYFPEPDLLPMRLTEIAEGIKANIAELPAERRARFMKDYGLTAADTKTICNDDALAQYVEKVFSELRAWLETNERIDSAAWDERRDEFARLVSGWLLTKLGGIMAENKIDIRTLKITPEDFAELLALIHSKKVTGQNALVILQEMAMSGADPSVILKEKSLGRIEDASEMVLLVDNILKSNPKAVEDWKSGKENAVQFLIGQLMKVTRGKAPADAARKLIEDELNKLK